MLASLIPIRTAVPWARAESMIRRIAERSRMLPGLRRILAAPASMASTARSGLKWMSATTGTRTLRTMRAKAAVSAGLGTATRTISQPAAVSLRICRTHASTSVVETLVMDWTTMGAPPPMRTGPTWTARVLRRGIMRRL